MDRERSYEPSERREVGLITEALDALQNQPPGTEVTLVETKPDQEAAIKKFMAKNGVSVSVTPDASEAGNRFKYTVRVEKKD